MNTHHCSSFILVQENQEKTSFGEDAATFYCNLVSSFLPVDLQKIQEGFYRVVHIINCIYGSVVLKNMKKNNLNLLSKYCNIQLINQHIR